MTIFHAGNTDYLGELDRLRSDRDELSTRIRLALATARAETERYVEGTSDAAGKRAAVQFFTRVFESALNKTG